MKKSYFISAMILSLTLLSCNQKKEEQAAPVAMPYKVVEISPSNTTLLAEYPAENRDESRMMVVNREKGTIEHKIFKDIVDYFDDGDVFVMNDTKVFPARLYGNKEKTGAKIEVFLLREFKHLFCH